MALVQPETVEEADRIFFDARHAYALSHALGLLFPAAAHSCVVLMVLTFELDNSS